MANTSCSVGSDVYKRQDEVRKAGLELGIPEKLVFRQPFPGPGLGIRIIGEVTAETVSYTHLDVYKRQGGAGSSCGTYDGAAAGFLP